MQKITLLALASLTFLCPFGAYAQPTATDIYNKAVDWTNLVKTRKFTYTEHIIHESDNAVLLRVATEIQHTLKIVQDSFNQLALYNPTYAPALNTFKDWAAK